MAGSWTDGLAEDWVKWCIEIFLSNLKLPLYGKGHLKYRELLYQEIRKTPVQYSSTSPVSLIAILQGFKHLEWPAKTDYGVFFAQRKCDLSLAYDPFANILGEQHSLIVQVWTIKWEDGKWEQRNSVSQSWLPEKQTVLSDSGKIGEAIKAFRSKEKGWLKLVFKKVNYTGFNLKGQKLWNPQKVIWK